MHQHDDESAFKFCPVCGARLEPRVLKASEPKRLVCTNSACEFVFYLDPKIAVGTIIRTGDHGKIVLVKRAIEPGFGKWVFPGGYVDRGEQITVAALREAREEAGVDIRLDHLINIYSYAGRAPVIVVYAATMLSGTLAIDDESSEIREFSVDEIPWDELAFPSTRDGLREYIEGRNTAPV